MIAISTAVIICNGSIEDFKFYDKFIDKADLIICADGGAVHARKMGVKPHILLGDFDSIPEDVLSYFKASGVNIMQFPPEKDMTDTEIAVELALKKGYGNIIIIGGIGSRLDHSLSNVFMLRRILAAGSKGIIVNEHNEIAIFKDRFELFREENVKITLLPLTERVEGVTTQGLYYPLNDATLEMGSTWGVSNEFAADRAEITIKNGLMLLIKARD